MNKAKNEDASGEILAIVVIIAAVLGIGLLILGGFAFHWFGSAADVVQKETDPHVMLQKYRVMLSQQNALEELNVNIKVYQLQLNAITEFNNGTPRNKWAASDREQYDNLANAVSASKITFNNLASRYNSEMKDISWAFCNQADLPNGATVVLNREYVDYTV